MVNRTDLLKRIERLTQRYNPEAQIIRVQFMVQHFVPADDPRCGSWALEKHEDTGAVVMDFVNFYCRDLAHFDQMTALHAAIEETQQEGPL